MAPAMDSAPTERSEFVPSAHLQQLFDQHLKILKEHLDLCSSLKHHQVLGSGHHAATQKCLDHTQEMIQDFKDLTTSFSYTKPDVPPKRPSQSSPGVKRSASPLTTLSEFINNLPSPQSPKKRRLEYNMQKNAPLDLRVSLKNCNGVSSTDVKPTTLEGRPTITPNEQARLSKQSTGSRLQTEEQIDSAPGQTTASAELNESQASAKQSKNEHELSINGITLISQSTGLEGEDLFLEKVRKRHQQKEDQRKKKLEKKRKRESRTSIESQDAQDIPKPQRKKQRSEEVQSEAQESDSRQEKFDTTSKKRGISMSRERPKRQRTD